MTTIICFGSIHHQSAKMPALLLYKSHTMKKILNVATAPASLRELMEDIHTGYYKTISALCNNILALSIEIKGFGLPYDNGYAALSERIVAETANYIDLRTTVFLPYINMLAQKDADGHNCSACSGRCELQHSENLIDFSMQLQQFKDKINDLVKASSKIYKRDEHYSLKPLHNKITLLYNIITELLYIEEDALLPKIAGAQRNIYAVR